MSSGRIVAVLGSTGLQGTSVVKSLLRDGTFKPRAVARNPESAAARELADLGAAVVKGDLLDKASLLNAFMGCVAVFGITVPMYYDGADDTGIDEVVQGKNLVDAAKDAGVKFLVFSSLPSLAKLTDGKFTKAKNAEDKATVEDYLRANGLPHAAIHPGFFIENLWRYQFLRKSPTGLTFSVPLTPPDTMVLLTWVERDIPAVVLALLKNYDSADADKRSLVLGGVFPVVTTCSTYGAVADDISNAIDAPVAYVPGPGGAPPGDDSWLGKVYLSKHDWVPEPVPYPALVKLGVHLSTMQDLIRQEIKPRGSTCTKGHANVKDVTTCAQPGCGASCTNN
ncbi:NmrA domain-containing protein [Mycena kentingensis (nom. inval.)]|nr:NmrA domain-containing protein [Mycena kentingensis (nom. inval.)]